MRRLGTAAAAAAVLLACFAPHAGRADPPAGRWVPGDLDVHTIYSSDLCKAPPVPNNCDADHNGQVAPPQNIGRAPIDLIHEAESRGLAFIAFTDHNTPSAGQCAKPGFPGPCSAQNDPAVTDYKLCHATTPAICPVLVLDGQEKDVLDANGLPSGRVGVVGYTGAFPGDHPSNQWSSSDLNAAIQTIHGQGGLVAAFVPADALWPWRYPATDVVLDGFEVWTGSWLDQREFLGPSSTDNPRADAAWQQRASALAAVGKQLPLLGSSDTHTLADAAAQGPGQPTLWVYDTADPPGMPVTWLGIRGGLAAGHAFVSNDVPSRGPRLYVQSGDYIGGDVAPATSTLSLTVRWENAPPGASIRIVGPTGMKALVSPLLCAPPGTDAATLASYRCNGSTTVDTLSFRGPCCRWLRAEMYIEDGAYPRAPLQDQPARDAACLGVSVWGDPKTCFSDRYLLLAMTNPLYSSQ